MPGDIDPILDTSETLVGVIFLIMPTLYAILSPFVGFLADTFTYQLPLLAFGLGGYMIAYTLMGPLPLLPFLPRNSLWLTIVALVLEGLFTAFCFMPSFAIINRDCLKAGLPNDLDLFGLISGTFMFVFNLGAFIGPLVGGVLVQNFGFEWASSIVAMLPVTNFVTFAIYLILSR